MINYKYFLKSIGYVVAVHLLAFGLAILHENRILSELAFFGLGIVLLLFLIPFYFVVKDDAPKPWFYRLLSFASLIFCVAMLFLGLKLRYPNGSWDILLYLFTELVLCVFLITILLADVVISLIQKHEKAE